MTPQEMVTEFHKAFNCLIDGERTDEAVATRLRLMGEEFGEVVSAMLVGTPEQLAKELADLKYVTVGAAVNFGIDLDKAFRIVHDSNMSKLGPDGAPIFREDGKVLKPPNYQEPDMSPAVKGKGWQCPSCSPAGVKCIEHSPESVELARALAAFFFYGEPYPDSERVGWFMDDAEVLRKDVGPGPYTVTRLDPGWNAEYAFLLNNLIVVIPEGGKDCPASPEIVARLPESVCLQA